MSQRGNECTTLFTGKVGAITYPYRNQARLPQQLFTNCATTLNLEQYAWTSLSLTVTCQEYEENTNFFPLTQYAAFALPQIQLATASPGFATEEIQEDTTGRCAELAAEVGAQGLAATVFGYSLGRTGCGLWERTVTVGPGRFCSPRHRMHFDSIHVGSPCVPSMTRWA